MAGLTHLGEIWASAVELQYQKKTIYRNLVNDRSAEVSSGADRLHIIDLESTSLTTRTYTAGTALSDALDQPVDSENSLILNKQHVIRGYVDRIHARQSGAKNVIAAFAERESNTLAQKIDQELRDVMFHSADFSVGNKNLITTNNFSDVTADGFADAFVADLLKAIEAGDKLSWPTEGRKLVVGPLVKRVLSQKILTEGVGPENTLQGFGFVGKILNHDVYMDSGLSDPTTANANVCLMLNSDSVQFAQQISEVQIDNNLAGSTGLFGTSISMLSNYGSKKVFPNKMILLKATA